MSPTVSQGRAARTRGTHLSAYLLLLTFIVPYSDAAAAQEKGEVFLECQQLFQASPTDRAGPYCFFEKAQREGRWREAESQLKDLLAENPGNAELQLALARVHAEQDSDTSISESQFKKALRLFSDEDNLSGQVRTRVALWSVYMKRRHQSAAEQQLAELLELRKRTTNTELLARIDITHSRNLFEFHSDFARAQQLVIPYEEYISTKVPFILGYRYLYIRGRIALELGMAKESFDFFVQAADLAKEQGRSRDYSSALGNALAALRDQLDGFSDEEGRKEAIEFTKKVLENARRSGSLISELKAMIVLADLSRDPDKASALYSECAARAKAGIADPDILITYKTCRFALAEEVALVDPERARKIVEDLWEEVPNEPDILENVYDKHGEMRVLWNIGSSEEAWNATVEVLQAIENIRDAQLERFGRSRSFSAWAMTYPWLAGRLLEDFSSTGSKKALERAFNVVEQMRSRLLLDILETTQVRRRDTLELRTKRNERLELVEERNRLQRILRVTSSDETHRTRIQAQLDKIQDQERTLRSEIARESGLFADLEHPVFATIPAIQRNLGPTEALFSFHLAPWQTAVEEFAGGSWLIVLTAESANAYRLPNERDIEQRVSVLTGLLEKGQDGAKSSKRLASRLYGDLLGEALHDLPSHVTDLILIPDKALHRLAFAALRPAEDEPPLATRYRLSRVPSATLWLRRWRERSAPPAASQPALVLADPFTETTSSSEESDLPPTPVASLLRDASLLRAESYGPLPFAREEGWSVVRQLGRGTKFLTGLEASERFLKDTKNLNRFGILHFAAHAVANEEEPDRAGVMLAPDLPANGGDSGGLDGFLQFNEIVDLGFEGRTVVLSTCQSARGQILRGEGVFDLARAFFEGGARAVVGSLWQLEDKATAKFFDDFYRHLARGVSLSEALHQAQTDQIRRGVPPSVWAGIVVIGDGSLVPVPSRGDRHHPAWPIALALVLLAVTLGVAVRRNP